MANKPRKESTTLTFRVGKAQKQEWIRKAKAAGMSLTLYISYVLDRTDVTVAVSMKTSEGGPPPRR